MMRNIIIAIITIVYAASVPAAELGEVDIHGFISQGYLKSDDNNYLADTEDGSFQFNEMGINFATRLTSRLRCGMQFFARDLGDFGNDEMTLDWAYGDYRLQDWLGFRVGMVKAPLGLYNETRDFDMLRTSILLPQSNYADHLREEVGTQRGIGIYGDISLGPVGMINYQALFSHDDVSNDGGGAVTFKNNIEPRIGGIKVNNFSSDKTYNGSLIWQTPLDGLKIGGSTRKSAQVINYTYLSNNDTVDFDVKSVRFYTGSVEYMYENFTFSSEYYRMTVISNFKLSSTAEPIRAHVPMEGWYASMSYRFTDWFELGSYYCQFFPDRKDRKGTKPDDWTGAILGADAFQKDLTVSTRFDINASWILKLEGHFIDGTALVDNTKNTNASGDVDMEQHWVLFLAKMSYSF